MRRFAIVVLAGCTHHGSGGVTGESSAPRCEISARPAAPAPMAVAGYPLPIPVVLPLHERETRLAELAAASPGWTWGIDPYGTPTAAESEVVGLAADPMGDAQLAYARRLAAALAPVGATVSFAVVNDRIIGTGTWRDGTPISLGVERRLLLYAHNRGPRAVQSPATQAWRGRVNDDGKLIVLDVEIPRPPPPVLPAGTHELSFAELDARWGHAYSTGTVRITRQPERHPCDPVRPGDCASSHDEGASSECVSAATAVLALRKLIIAPDGLRYVTLMADGDPQGMIEIAAPRCLDAVTGEDLDGKADCGSANGGGYYIFYR